MPPGARMTVLASAPVAEDMASMPFCTSLICSSAVMYVRFTPCPLPEAWSQVCVHIWCPASCARFTVLECDSIWFPMVKNVALASYWSRMSRIWSVESGQGPSSNVRAITLSSPTLAL